MFFVAFSNTSEREYVSENQKSEGTILVSGVGSPSIDNKKEDSYGKIVWLKICNISYANDGSWHYFFVESKYNFSNRWIKLSSEVYSFNITENYIKHDFIESRFANYTAEIKFSRELYGNMVRFQDSYLDVFTSLIPSSPGSSSVVYVSSGDGDDEKEKNAGAVTATDWIVSLGKRMTFGAGILIGVLITLFVSGSITLIWRYTSAPICFFKTENSFKAKKYGRFVGEEECKELPGHWILKFKSKIRGVKLLYSLHSFSNVRTSSWRKVYGLEDEYPFYTVINKKLQEYEYFKERVIKKNWKYYLFRIVCFINFNNKITKEFYNSLDRVSEETIVKEIPFLYFDIMIDEITHVCDVEFDRTNVDQKLGVVERHETKTEVPLYYVDDLKRDKSINQDSIKVIREYTLVREHKSLMEAIMNSKSKMEIRSVMEAKIRRQYTEIKLLNEEITRVREELRFTEIKHIKEVQDALIQAKADMSSVKDITQYTSDLLSEIDGGAGITDAINNAVNVHLKNKEYKSSGELLAKINELNGILSLKEQTIKDLRDTLERNNGGRRDLFKKIPLSSNLDHD